MSLRTRLILAFFTLSVVPLGAVTFYSYTNNVKALREAAEREADLLAGELGQRMELVTAQLSERVEHLMDVTELQAAVDDAEAAQAALEARAQLAITSPLTKPAPAAPATVTTSLLNDSIAKSLGEAAMLLNNVELRGFGRGGGRPPGSVTVSPTAGRTGTGGRSNEPPPPGGSGRGTGAGAGATSQGANRADPERFRGRPQGPPPQPPDRQSGQRTSQTQATGAGASSASRTGAQTAQPSPAPQVAAAPNAARVGPVQGASSTPPAPGIPPQPPPVPMTRVDANGKLMIDMSSIRRDMMRQIIPEGRMDNLKPEERERVAAEINQRMLGIAQGIKIGAVELQKRAQQAEMDAENSAKAKAALDALAKQKQQRVSTAGLQRKATLTGNRIDVKFERDGQVVRQMNAEMNLPNVLATVFSTTRSDRGEVPFAVAKDGTIFTRAEADRTRVASFGDVAKPAGPAMARLNEWIVVTTEDKSGSGLRMGIARPVSDSLATLRRTAARNAGMGLLFITIALIGIVPISAGLTRNLTVLNDAVSRIARGEYHTRVPEKTAKSKDEVGRLAVAFNKMAADVERHQQTAVEQERIRRELELGREIQNEMLPHAPLHLGLTEVQGVSVPAKEVGGDFFNYFVLDTGHVALLMGDVSGKGVGAALLMANIQASLRIRLALGQDLSAVADALDRDIDANSPGPVYATIFIGILDPVARRLRYVNAGHNPQYVLRTVGGLERMPATGLPVGLLSGRGYTEQQVQLAAGDQLFFYTDGCVETENDRTEMFGLERLEPLLVAAAKSLTPIKTIEQGIAAFRGTSEPLDDATLMTVRVG